MIIIEIFIDKQSGVPLYIQVKKQIMKCIKEGLLKVSDKMPTERELSERLKVSRNTVSTAYSELEQEGVLKSYQGKGTFVAEEVKPWTTQNIKEKIIKFVDLGLEEALETGMDGDEFLEIVNQRVKEKKELMKKILAVYVECNIEQARVFSEQLSTSTGMNIIPLTVNDLKEINDETKNILDKTQVIISTFNHVNEVTQLTANFKREVLGVAINPDLETIVRIARYPQETNFGFICISEEFKFKVRGALEKSGLGNINVIYSNSKNEKEIKNIIDKSDVIIVSPGRFKEVERLNNNKKPIVRFLYNLDDGSVKALKSKIIETQYQK